LRRKRLRLLGDLRDLLRERPSLSRENELLLEARGFRRGGIESALFLMQGVARRIMIGAQAFRRFSTARSSACKASKAAELPISVPCFRARTASCCLANQSV
jgi:hypothetical protein